MSSREIAELTGKDHRNVLRDIDAMLAELEIDVLSFEHIYLDSMNREQREFILPKRETLILVSGYSALMRAKIIDRWQDLETRLLQETQKQLAEAKALLIEAPSPDAIAKKIFDERLALATSIGTPRHIGLIEAWKAAYDATGINYLELVNASEVNDNIVNIETMHAPTTLAAILLVLDFNGGPDPEAMNVLLYSWNLQTRVRGRHVKQRCIATKKGEPLSATHQWARFNGDSGYNLKWNLEEIDTIHQAHLAKKARYKQPQGPYQSRNADGDWVTVYPNQETTK